MKWALAIAAILIAAPLGGGPLDDTFAAGETLDYNLQWLGMVGGSMRMTIGVQPGDPSRYRITSFAESRGSIARLLSVRDEIIAIVNRNDFSTVRYEKHLNERGRSKDDTTIIDERRHIATRRRPGKDTEEISVPKPVFDPLSIVYYIRQLDLSPGKVHRFDVFADGKLYTMEVTVTGRERVETAAGTFDAVSVDPRPASGTIFKDDSTQMTLWFTDDRRHIPVRIRTEVKVGTINATLKSVTAGTGSIQP